MAALLLPTLKYVISELLQRIRTEYSEMLGLHLTTLQARQFGPDCATCDTALAALVDSKSFPQARGALRQGGNSAFLSKGWPAVPALGRYEKDLTVM